MAQCQFKVVRQIGENIWPYKRLTSKQNKLVDKQRQRSNLKSSDFGKRLINNKKISLFYGKVSLRKIKHHLLSSRAQKTASLMLILETRLDTLLVRAQFCKTTWTARQLIIHEKVRVNNRVIDYPSYSVMNGDVVSIVQEYQKQMELTMNKNNLIRPSHIEVNSKIYSFILLQEPRKIAFPYMLEPNLI
jgi:small subunit ribosomal protein S4